MALSSMGGTVLPSSVRRDVEASLSGGRDVRGLIFKLLLQAALLLTVVILAVLLGQVISLGWETVATRLGDFLTAESRSRASEAGVFQGLRGTLWIAVVVTVVAFPLGIAAAVYLEEYAPRGRLTNFIELNIRNLAGVPSVVYGILAYTIFVVLLKPVTGGKTALSGALAVALLVLPVVIITSAEALRAVPSTLREAGYGVGATRWEVTRSHVLPYAAPGILTGTLLSLGRALGEAAPLILVGAIPGSVGYNGGLLDPGQLREQFTAMPIVIASWSTNARQGFDQATAAAIVVLLTVVLMANATAIILRNRFEKKR
ncbi:MAG: phosphate ABC transporter permease PstA [Acidimicrobiales bacterium]